MRILAVNAGSSSVKLRVVEDGDTVAAHADLAGDAGDNQISRFAEGAGALDAVAHRIVHGGPDHTAPTLVDGRVRAALASLADLAPLHNPPALRALDAVRRVLPGVPTVACFDTAFHATLPEKARTYAIPREWRERHGIRRYGFHGLAHGWSWRRVSAALGRDDLRLVSCHLGSGASLCAISAGHSVDTTMGFTPLEGLVMATRSGSVDPGALLWLQQHAGIDAAAVSDSLEHGSGLLALAGSADMRAVVSAAERGESDAALALDIYLHRLTGLVAAMTAALGGLDALSFSGGVGEHAAWVRRRTAERLRFLGVGIEEAAVPSTDLPITEITGRGASVRSFVVPAREELEMAHQVRSLLGSAFTDCR